MNHEPTCERCGVPQSETEIGVLAFNGALRVCAECNSDLDNEWVADNPGSLHPLNTFCPAAHVAARFA